MITLKINGKENKIEVDPTTPLLWVLRDHLQLPAPNTGVVSHNAVPALFIWMDVLCAPV